MGNQKDQATTILLVEDEVIIRMASAAMLEDFGYLVIEAANADEALRSLRDHPEIDIIITDVQMPGSIDGLGLIEIVARDYPHIETLITSGRTGSRDARQSGAKSFIAKPYTAAAIQTALKASLTRH